MKETEEQLRSLFAEARVAVPPEVAERMARRSTQLSGTSQRVSSFRNVRSSVARFAAAIAFLAMAGLFLYEFGPLIHGSQTALALIRHAIDQVPWVHITATVHTEQQSWHTWEVWYSPQRKVRIIRSDGPHGYTQWSDFLVHERRLYDPNLNKLTLYYEYKEPSKDLLPPQSYLSYIFGSDIHKDARITEKAAPSENPNTVVYEIAFEESETPISLKIVADATTSLPILMTGDTTVTEGQQQPLIEAHFDFPTNGPADIYALGVPSDATVVDNRPTPGVEELAKICGAYRASLRRYIFIVLLINQPSGDINQIEVNYVEGDTSQAGREWKALQRTYLTWPHRGQQFDVEAFDTVDDVLDWIESDDRVQLWGIRLWDGRYAHSLYRDKGPAREKDRDVPGLRQLHGYAWPCYLPMGRIGDDAYARERGLICWQAQGRSLYFDPSHDHVCVRLEQSNGCWIRDAVDFAQTDAGLCYPRTVRLTIVEKDVDGNELSRRVTVNEKLFLKPIAEFPEGMFDAASLPETVESIEPADKVLQL